MAIILAVDDSPVILRLLEYTLRRSGHTVIAADGCEQAWDVLLTQPIELVISDISMPKIDGMTLLRWIRADHRFETLPFVILTASFHDDDHEAAQAAGVNAFLTKPASSHELIETVQQVLGNPDHHSTLSKACV